jgi:hypothetical protein
VSERSAEIDAERLRQLSEEVSRLAATLARLSMDAVEPQLDADPDAGQMEVPVELVNSVVRARRLRERYFPKEIFADPAWEMMLDLLKAEVLQQRVPVSSLCIAAAVPTTTALRWLKTMVDHGLLIRRPDPVDLRRVFVELAPETSATLRRYFAELQAGDDGSP